MKLKLQLLNISRKKNVKCSIANSAISSAQ